MKKIFVPKSEFKPKAFEFFRLVEQSGREVCITDHGKPVVKIVPYRSVDEEILKQLAAQVERYEEPLKPVGEEWEAAR